jgi:hypothetical protein
MANRVLRRVQATFEALTAVLLRIRISWQARPCPLVSGSRRFQESWRLHVQGPSSPRRTLKLSCSLEDEGTTISPSRRYESSAILLICGKTENWEKWLIKPCFQMLRLYSVGDGPARATLAGRKATDTRSTINHTRSGLISNSGLRSAMHEGSVSMLSLA